MTEDEKIAHELNALRKKPINAKALAVEIIRRAANDALNFMGDMRSNKSSEQTRRRTAQESEEFLFRTAPHQLNEHSDFWFLVAGVKRPKTWLQVERIAKIGNVLDLMGVA